MTTDLATTDPLAGKMAYAQALSHASLLPRAYQKAPGNILLAQEYALALDLPVMTVIQTVHIIEGKPSASAQLIGALVRRAGHRLRVTGNDTAAVAEVVRCDDPEFIFRSEWTLERARAAGLAGKGTWKAYPAAMLKARAITEVARDACPEALMGVAYTPEELGATVTSDGTPLTLSQPAAPAVDWAAEVAAATDLAQVRRVWHDIKDAGALTPALQDALTARANEIQAADVVDVEIVEVDEETGEVEP